MSVYETEEELAARIRELEAELDELNSSPWKARCQVARDDANTARQLAEFHRDRARAAEAERDEYRMAAEAEAEGLNEWQARAEKAEAEALEQAKLVRTWADRAEKAEGDAREWKARATKAEAAVERVRALTMDGDGEWIHRGDLRGALDPKPAFTLPTEAGVRFTAQGKYDATGSRTEFITLIGGREPAYVIADGEEDIVYHAGGIMEHYADHRLLGADQ